MQLLRDVDSDEVSPVRRGANRKKVVLKADGEVQVEAEIADIMAVPWEREGALVDELRKADADETTQRAMVGAMRLLGGVADDLPEGMRDAVEKLGSELYARTNPKLNTSSVDSAGGLTGSSYGSPKDGSAGKQTDLEGEGTDGELIGSGSAPKVAADAEPDDDDMPAKKKRVAKDAELDAALADADTWFERIRKALKRDEAGTSLHDDDGGDPVVKNDDNHPTKEGDPVDTHAVPIQKEDGSWDLSGVPDDSRPFYQAMITKADETAVKLEKAKTDLAETREELRTREIVAKAETQFQAVGAHEDVVAVLKDAGAKLEPEAYERLVNLLSSANERIATGDLFKEAGYTGGTGNESGGDAWEKIEKAAEALVEKGDGEISQAQAIDRVLKTSEGQKLYGEYMAETGLGVS